MANVRFYRLETLPSFNVAKHQGIFVHVTKTMGNKKWANENKISFDAESVLITTIKNINLEQWLSTRHIEFIESGLWFGGENGWELLSNETNSAAINAAIDDKIATLNVGGYAQATMDTNVVVGDKTDSKLTIKGIKEVDGKIGIPADSENFDLDIAIDGAYNESTNKIATQSTVTTAVTTAINALDAETVQAVTKITETNGNTTLTFKGVQETNGVIAQGDGAETFIVGDAKLKIQIGSATTDVFSANAQSDSTIKLDGNVFKKDENNVISVITKNNDVSSTNPLVTQNDINGLASAMHYKGPLTGAQSGDGSWPSTSTVAAGDVYIVTTSFTHSGESNPFEVGDMIVFNTDGDNSKYTVVQSNITLGTGIGQVAANSAALAIGNLVVATDNGIKTISITETQLTGDDNNKRELSYRNGTSDTDTTNNITLHHDVTISDAFQVIGKDFTKTINISSTNRSIEIAANGSNTGVVVDLVWNTTIE